MKYIRLKNILFLITLCSIFSNLISSWIPIGNPIPANENYPSLSANGTTVAISNNVNVYKYNDTDWIKIGSTFNHSHFPSLSSDGTIVALSSPVFGSPKNVYIYQFNSTNDSWDLLGNDPISIPNSQLCSLSADGTIIAATNSDPNIGVAIYQLINSHWIQLGVNTIPNSDFPSLSADGTTVAVTNSDPTIGVVIYQFMNNTSTWIQLENIPNSAIYTLNSLSANGTTIAVEASNNVNIYRYNGTVWTQLGNTISNSNSPSLNADGNTFAVYDSDTSSVIVYQFDGTNWIQHGNSILDRETPSLSADGNTVAIYDNATNEVIIYRYQNSNNNLSIFFILNQQLAKASYSDISQPTTPAAPTNPAGLGQGAQFSAPHITVQG